jgi:hypothetical protein
LFSLPTETKMTDTGRQSSLTSFFFGKQKERDDGNKENQPELIKDRKRTRQSSINKGSDMKVKENMNRQSFLFQSAMKTTHKIIVDSIHV